MRTSYRKESIHTRALDDTAVFDFLFEECSGSSMRRFFDERLPSLSDSAMDPSGLSVALVIAISGDSEVSSILMRVLIVFLFFQLP